MKVRPRDFSQDSDREILNQGKCQGELPRDFWQGDSRQDPRSPDPESLFGHCDWCATDCANCRVAPPFRPSALPDSCAPCPFRARHARFVRAMPVSAFCALRSLANGDEIRNFASVSSSTRQPQKPHPMKTTIFAKCLAAVLAAARMPQVVRSISVAALLVSLSASSPAIAASLYVGCQGGTGGWQQWDTQTGQLVLGSSIGGIGLSVVTSGSLVYNTDLSGIIRLSSTDGSFINQNFITPSNSGYGLAISGNVLYSVGGNGLVSSWDATTGASINASFISGLNSPYAMLVSGNSLFVGDAGGISQWDAATGQVINRSFMTAFSPIGIAVSGNRLFASNYGSDAVGVFDLATGSVIDANFITGVPTPKGLAVDGSTLYVASCDTGSYIGTYDVNTGAAINSQYMQIYGSPSGLFIAPPSSVPEIDPAMGGSALSLVAGVLAMIEQRRRRATLVA